METKTSPTGTELRLVRRYAAPPARVFDALTNPDLLARWIAPNDDYDVHVERFEAHVGGTYRIDMHHQDGNVFTCMGTIQEIEAPDRLVYTWKWGGGEMSDTLVTWRLKATAEGTEVTLTHERFPNSQSKESHLKGWIGCTERLTQLF